MTLFLKSVRIINFKSLADVTLHFRDLTILVGANGSGKSNCLEALYFLSMMIAKNSLPSLEILKQLKWMNTKEDIQFMIEIEEEYQENNRKFYYHLSLEINDTHAVISREKLTMNNINLIDLNYGMGKIYDEELQNYQDYQLKIGNVALNSTEELENRPNISQVSEFITTWQILNPDLIRKYDSKKITKANSLEATELALIFEYDNKLLEKIIMNWLKHDPDKMATINHALNKHLQISLKIDKKEHNTLLFQQSQDNRELPFSILSIGQLRMIAYYVLRYMDDLPPLIGIEEPERNIHPRLFLSLTTVVEKLSKGTQLIITTHSYHLLDCFTLEEIQEDVMVLCLTQNYAKGTQIFALDKLGEKREDLTDWMLDFGVGSAVYNSNLLEEYLEEQYA